MNNSNIFKTFFLLTAIIFIHAFSATNILAASCSSSATFVNSDGEVSDSGITAKCTVTPDTVYFPVYKIGLCKVVPTFENYQTACNVFYEKSTDVLVEVSKSSNLELKTGVNLENATYKAAIILLGNSISLKHSQTFEGKRTGMQLISGSYEKTSGAADTGTVCVTQNISGNADFTTAGLESFLTCYEIDDPALPSTGIFEETSGAYSTEGDVCSVNSSTGLVNAPTVLTVTASNNDTVKFCGMENDTTLEKYSGTSTNATRQLAIQEFDTNVVTTKDTKSIDIGFKVTDMLMLEERTVNGTTYTNAFIEGVSLTFTVK